MTTWPDTYAQAREIGKRVSRQRNKYSFSGHLQRWLSSGIGTVKQLSAVSGYCESDFYHIKNGDHSPSSKTAADILQAMGIIEREHIAKWQQERARRACGDAMVEKYRTGVQHESH